MTNIKDRFETKFIICNTGCWEWTACKAPNGYGKISIKGKSWYAHRLSWSIYKSEQLIPEIFVCHKCDNRGCVNPEHLFLGTALDNSRDMIQKNRMNIRPIFSCSSEKHYRSKLTNEQAVFIRTSTLKTSELAKRFNVHMTTVQRIRSGSTFRDIL